MAAPASVERQRHDTYADDLAGWSRKLDLQRAIHVGHSTGGGEVARYIGRHGTKRVVKAVLIGAVPPLMLKTAANPGGLPKDVFDGIRAGVLADRSKFFMDLTLPFYGYNRPNAKVSEGVRPAILASGHDGRNAPAPLTRLGRQQGRVGDRHDLVVVNVQIKAHVDFKPGLVRFGKGLMQKRQAGIPAIMP